MLIGQNPFLRKNPAKIFERQIIFRFIWAGRPRSSG
jgi:hypothetical protein